MSQEKICPTCGTEYPANERFCPRDGTALRSQGESNDLVGSIIAERYHVIKKLGEGGMGQVYLAEHVKMGRKSAVKVMNSGMVNDADAISRFNREAANASRINHPNVAGIYDFGETSDGLIYLAMEFIEGESLTSIVEKAGALPPLRAADIAKQTADGLAVAHDMGIVHRDLKPDNIMIAKNRNGTDLVKVVDFGIAKAAGSENQKVTKTGLVVGTPEYMSPEQLAGDTLNGQSDIYSLALVTYNMLTGTLPFQGETAQESMIMRLTDDPRSLTETKPDVAWTAEVQDVMARGLKRKSAERYEKATDFGDALYMAVERMPKGAAAAGGSPLLTTTPPTRVNAGAAGVPVTKPAGGTGGGMSKIPMIAGGVAALAIAVVAFVLLKGGTPPVKSESTALPPTASAVAPTGTPTPQSVVPAPVAGSAGSSPSVPIRSVPSPAPASVRSSAPNESSLKLVLDTLDELSNREGSTNATLLLKRLDAVEPRATSSEDRTTIEILRAQAYGTLNDDARACATLKAALPKADPVGGRKIKRAMEAGKCE
jgi:serine/threonine protein kinase